MDAKITLDRIKREIYPSLDSLGCGNLFDFRKTTMVCGSLVLRPRKIRREGWHTPYSARPFWLR